MFKDSEEGQTQCPECQNCKYWKEEVCCNGESEFVAEYRLKENTCDKWEGVKRYA